MLKSINIINFQSHKASKLEFSPNVNVILGSSDSGKTSILRALRWVAWNRPTGDEFRSHWAGKEPTAVDLVLDENEHVVRIKDNSINGYKLAKSSFNAIGTDVPKEISDILNLNDVNLSRQLDAPFLLSDTPGEIAQHFNKVAHLDQIDTGLKQIQSAIRTLEQSKKLQDANLVQLNTTLEQYADLEKLDIEVEVIESLQTKYTTTINNEHKLKQLVENLQAIQDTIEVVEEISGAEGDVNNVLKLIDKREKTLEEADKLNKLITSYYDIKEELIYHSEMLPAEKDINRLLELIETCDKSVETAQILSDKVIEIISIREDIAGEGIRLVELEEAFHEEMGDVCILCNQKIKK